MEVGTRQFLSGASNGQDWFGNLTVSLFLCFCPRRTERVLAVWRSQEAISWGSTSSCLHGKRPPRDMGVQEVQQFLSPLAVEGHVASSTQSQALSAMLSVYQQVLTHDSGWLLHDVVRAKQSRRLRVILTRDEAAAMCGAIAGHAIDHGNAPVWCWGAPDGVPSPASARTLIVPTIKSLSATAQRTVDSIS